MCLCVCVQVWVWGGCGCVHARYVCVHVCMMNMYVCGCVGVCVCGERGVNFRRYGGQNSYRQSTGIVRSRTAPP